MKRVCYTVLLTVVLTGLAALATVFVVAQSGAIDVSARKDRSGLLHWFFKTTRENSVERRSAGIRVPDLGSTAMRRAGLAHYDSMCSGCHGAPGRGESAVQHGLNPSPPSLLDGPFVRNLDPREAFWVVRNGIWASGMPAFGPTHSDEDIWSIVAAVQELPSMGEDEYRATLSHAGHHRHRESVEASEEHGSRDDRQETNDGEEHEDGP